MDAIDTLFRKKTEEAGRILGAAATTNTTTLDERLPFEVNKVLGKIQEETVRRAKLSKRKPAKVDTVIKEDGDE